MLASALSILPHPSRGDPESGRAWRLRGALISRSFFLRLRAFCLGTVMRRARARAAAACAAQTRLDTERLPAMLAACGLSNGTARASRLSFLPQRSVGSTRPSRGLSDRLRRGVALAAKHPRDQVHGDRGGKLAYGSAIARGLQERVSTRDASPSPHSIPYAAREAREPHGLLRVRPPGLRDTGKSHGDRRAQTAPRASASARASNPPAPCAEISAGSTPTT